MALLSAFLLTPGLATAADEEAHATSSYMLSAISAGLPKFDPAKSEAVAAAAKAAAATEHAANTVPAGVMAMPAFTIMEKKLPRDHQLDTFSGWTQPLVDKYMGPSDGLDRGVLNRFTLAQLWAKIPILGRLPFVGTAAQMSVGERALDDAGANNPLRTKPIE
jgi:hypothetical protein